MMHRLRTVPALVAGALACGALAAVSATTSASAVDVCSTTDKIPARALAHGLRAHCDLTGRVVDGGLMSAQVPADGLTVHAEALMPAGVAEVPTLVVKNDGGVVTASLEEAHADHAGEAHAAEDGAAAAVGKGCRTSGANPFSYKWKSPYYWRYQAGSTPVRYSKDKVEYHLRTAARNVAAGRNACGLRGDPRLKQVYRGRTSKAPNVVVNNGSIACGAGNTNNVVGFKSLPGPLAVACTWTYSADPRRAAGSDVAIDKSKLIVLKFGRSCINKYDLQGVMTHEFTHSAGFGHVNNNVYTMDPTAVPCSYFARTYARGEWVGMKNKYGLS